MKKLDIKTPADTMKIVVPKDQNIPAGYSILGNITVVNIVSLKDTFIFTPEYFRGVVFADLFGALQAREGNKEWKKIFDAFEMTLSDSRGLQIYPELTEKQREAIRMRMNAPIPTKPPVAKSPALTPPAPKPVSTIEKLKDSTATKKK